MPLSRNVRSYRNRNALLSSGSVALGAALLALAALLLIVHLFVPGLLTSAAAPLWRVGNGTASVLQSAESVFGNAPALTSERDRLAAENLALHEENRTLVAQNTDLKKLIGNTPAEAPRILAGVLARPPVAPYDTLVVSAGSGNGVKAGALAYGDGGVPLGTVASVSATTATIDLFSRGGRAADGWIGDARVPVTLTGKGAGAFTALLPRDSGVAVGAVVYVPGPGALPIGTVVRIDSDPSSPRDTLYVAPYVNLFSLAWVEIAPNP